ncbi:MAG: hypothetical protein R3229_04520 [Alphaproteobacteria bacterium]|nr:hypothetical protein [Alphaproteobacteria bacterium]
MDLSALLRSPLAGLFLRPAYDRLAVKAIAGLYFPLSRAWAAGLAADGDAERLMAALPTFAGRRAAAGRALDRLAPRARAYAAALAAWEDALFAAGGGDGVLADLEHRRAAAAQSLMAGRLCFLGAHLRRRFPPIAWSVPGRDAVARRHGPRLASAAEAFAPGAVPQMETSRAIAEEGFETYWLRAPARVGGEADTLWARVEAPSAPGPHPVLVFTHGICMESEFIYTIGSPSGELAASGLAVIRPEGPYHGRRRMRGFFGGEPVIALGPMGMLDYFEAHVRELAWLTAWARTTFGGPVAVGGVSLGALAAQLAAVAAADWPAAMRPDAVFLVTGSQSVMAVVTEGALPRALGAMPVLEANGWPREAVEEWMPLLEPRGKPALDGDRIVALLGAHDEITPYGEGQHLMDSWSVPPANVFLRNSGHFTAALSLYRDPAPFERLRAVLQAG